MGRFGGAPVATTTWLQLCMMSLRTLWLAATHGAPFPSHGWVRGVAAHPHGQRKSSFKVEQARFVLAKCSGPIGPAARSTLLNRSPPGSRPSENEGTVRLQGSKSSVPNPRSAVCNLPLRMNLLGCRCERVLHNMSKFSAIEAPQQSGHRSRPRRNAAGLRWKLKPPAADGIPRPAIRTESPAAQRSGAAKTLPANGWPSNPHPRRRLCGCCSQRSRFSALLEDPDKLCARKE